MTSVNIALRRQAFVLDYFTQGNIPDSLIGVPETWTPNQIASYQKYWDAYFDGDLTRRRRAKFVPGGVAKTFVQTKEPDLKSPFDEWLARVVCFAFSVSPQALVAQTNRATAQTQKEAAQEEGLAPVLAWVKGLIDDLLADEFASPDIEFVWSADPAIDPQTQETILTSYATKGILTINEVRAALGREPLTDDAANKPMTLTANGYVGLDSQSQQQKMAADKIAKFNPYHDDLGRFTTADGAGSAAGKPASTAAAKPADGRVQVAELASDVMVTGSGASAAPARPTDGRVQVAQLAPTVLMNGVESNAAITIDSVASGANAVTMDGVALDAATISEARRRYPPRQPPDDAGRPLDQNRGYGDNSGDSPPPKIPEDQPPAPQRYGVVKEIAQSAEQASAEGREAYVKNVLRQAAVIAWLISGPYYYYYQILANLDPPKSLQELQDGANTPTLGYHIHHIVERGPALNDEFPESWVESHDNLVRIPEMKHREITEWYQTPNQFYDGLSPREYLRGKSWGQRRVIGIQKLIDFGVLER